MQTFLPSPDYYESLDVLDPKRLGNQVWREGLTLLRGGWGNHPASKMWADNRHALGRYLLEGVKVLHKRVGSEKYDNIKDLILVEMEKHEDTGDPFWLGDERLHASHRAALLYKNFEWYSRFGWAEQPDVPNEQGKLNYIWPV